MPPASAAVPPVPAPSRATVHITPAAVVTGTAAVLVVGTVLVSTLLAVAVTAASVALVAVVLRLLLKDNNHR